MDLVTNVCYGFVWLCSVLLNCCLKVYVQNPWFVCVFIFIKNISKRGNKNRISTIIPSPFVIFGPQYFGFRLNWYLNIFNMTLYTNSYCYIKLQKMVVLFVSFLSVNNRQIKNDIEFFFRQWRCIRACVFHRSWFVILHARVLLQK